jgi:putative FmdB family regulatory protein
MPLYEYRCAQCGEPVALRRSMSDETVPACPQCGAEKLVRRFSRISVARSEGDRARDLSWIDRDVARRIRNKASDRLNPSFGETLDRMESSG